MSTTKAVREQEKQEAIDQLRKMIQPGDTVYTVLRYVSRSGMQRGIDLYIIGEDRRPRWITAYVGKALDRPQSRKDWQEQRGLSICGCGMDMGFSLVYDLGRALYHNGNAAGYSLKHEWL